MSDDERKTQSTERSRTDRDEENDILRDLRAAQWKTRRRIAATLGLNLLLAGLFVAFPWWRGRSRAADARDGFATFAACLLGGRAVSSPGLALPRAAYDRLAYLALDDSASGRSWPSRCAALVDGISPAGDPPTLVLPWARSAEAELDETLPRLSRALSRVVDARRRGPIRAVPYDLPTEIERVVAKLANFATEAGSPPDLETPALDDRSFGALTAAARPTRVFLGYRGDTSLTMRVAQNARSPAGFAALHLVLWDRTRTGTASVTERGPREHRVLATPPAWGPITDDVGRTWLVRISRREQCGDQCDRRATGLAPLDVVAGRVSPVRWMRASVVGRPDRSLAIAGDDVRVIAGDDDRLMLVVLDAASGERRAAHVLDGFGRGPAAGRAAHPPGAIALVADRARTVVVDAGRFEPPPPPVVEAPTPDAPAGGISGDATVTADAVVAPRVRGPRIAVLDERGLRVLPTLDALEGDDAWTLACRAGSRTWIAFGTTRAVRMATLDDADDRLTLGAARDLGAPDDVALDDADGDGQRLRCDASGATLAMRTASPATLAATVCERDATSCVERTVAPVGDSSEWDLVRTSRGHVVAWSAARAGAQIRAQGFDRALRERGAPVAPTVCWEPERGLCGRPRLVADGTRVLVAAALSASVVVLQSDDDGIRWRGLDGR